MWGCGQCDDHGVYWGLSATSNVVLIFFYPAIFKCMHLYYITVYNILAGREYYNRNTPNP